MRTSFCDMYTDKFGISWYPLFKQEKESNFPFLTRDFPRKTLSDKLVVQAVTIKGDYKFAVFNNYANFYNYLSKIPETSRCFFETILGEYSQKSKFDLDINPKFPESGDTSIPINLQDLINHEDIKDDLVSSIIKVFDQHKVDIKLDSDIIVCTSHSNGVIPPDLSTVPSFSFKKFKRSYHVIVDNYYHDNNLEAQAFCNLVYSNMKDEYKQYLDTSVYKSLQQFRMLGCQKRDSGRPKKLCDSWFLRSLKIERPVIEFKTDQEKGIYLLSATLIGNCNYCKPLPKFATPSDLSKHNFISIDDVSNITAKRALIALAKYGGIQITDPIFPYEIRKINGCLIDLKRKRPSRCAICERVHEAENPYIIIKNSGAVYYHCRRADNGKLLVGNIEIEKEEGTSELDDIINDEDIEIKGDFMKQFILSTTKSEPIALPEEIKGVNMTIKIYKVKFDKSKNDLFSDFNKSKESVSSIKIRTIDQLTLKDFQ